jgi:deoxyribodipyrimidine photo-lyase
VSTSVWWLRRDLRLDDNPALQSAIRSSEEVIPLFILDPSLRDSGKNRGRRSAFLLASLRSLDEDLRVLGSRLIVREGEPHHVLTRILAETEARAIFAQADVSPYARKRDEAIRREMPLHLTEGLTIKPLQSVMKGDGYPYTVFTPYQRAWRSLPSPDAFEFLPRPERINTPVGIESLPIPLSPPHELVLNFPAGEHEALRRLQDFTTGTHAPIFRYGEDRDRPDLHGTSTLSPYLRFGLLSPRRAAARAAMTIGSAMNEEQRRSAESWMTELAWREFYIDILYHFPEVLRMSFRPAYREIAWSNNRDDFNAWRAGQTGYPIVDAAMRQLDKTGWMHNRARMIAASFLVKDLLIDWRMGERWFMQQLLDGDPAANNGGWQWTAGTGTDAAPYFRIFNPILQGKKFDPRGVYVREWVSELRAVPARFIHEPWKMPPDIQRESGCIIGRDFPSPIVDHAWARGRTMAAFQTAREGVDKVHTKNKGDGG